MYIEIVEFFIRMQEHPNWVMQLSFAVMVGSALFMMGISVTSLIKWIKN